MEHLTELAHRRMVNTRRLWSPKDKQAWVHDRFDDMDMHDFHGDNCHPGCGRRFTQESTLRAHIRRMVNTRRLWSPKDEQAWVHDIFDEMDMHDFHGCCLSFANNAGVIVNPKGDMKGFTITGPIGKDCANLWPRIASAANAIVWELVGICSAFYMIILLSVAKSAIGLNGPFMFVHSIL
ncbi:60S ribosomal protein L23 [Zea mays]|uniref:60S ribosomal protein L23 n=1 Tax=Zea mays TaxID=4577 RepID=A0A3L6FN36_MAIZE|nr:60S ribosomal protein L23 [Zea mays]